MANRKEKEIRIDVKKGKVNVNFLNIRKEPSLNSEIIGVISKDQTLTILNMFEDNGFISIKINGVSGFVKKEYIDIV